MEAFYLQVSQQSRTVMFINSQYPSLHLTVSWMNRSGELDIHMTREFTDAPKLHSSILKIKEADMEKYAKWLDGAFATQLMSLIRSFLASTKPIRPGWLRRRGYVIFWVPEEDQQQLIIDKLFKRHRKRGVRLYSNALSNLDVSEAFEEHLYDPSILHFIARNNEGGWIQALPLIGRRKSRRKNMSLKFVNFFDGKGGWLAIDSLVPGLEKIFEPVRQYVDEAIPRILTKVFDELCLHELGIKHDEFVNSFKS